MSEELMGNEVAEAVEADTTEKKAEVQGEEQANRPVPEKKYSDEDVDKIIARKIAAERKRMSKLFTEEQQETELEKRERAVLLRELKADAKDALIGQGLPQSLSGLLNYSSKEELEQSMDEVGKLFRGAVAEGVKSTLCHGVPQTGQTGFKKDDGVGAAFAPKR